MPEEASNDFMVEDTGKRPIAIVTGASRQRGIGAAVCRALAAMGVDIFFTYWAEHDQAVNGLERQGPHELLSKLRDCGVRCACLEIDQGLPEAASQIMDEVEKRRGRIINLTSGQGLGAMPGKIPYIATKGAIEAFTVTLALASSPF
ncbi:hypothetical protein ccbrp13_55160 [Ktedonobacteria bacterium brp13]|nr:hypothetical protein ccbrp13_55160 [Ktedonobacteria bacterium brp13]